MTLSSINLSTPNDRDSSLETAVEFSMCLERSLLRDTEFHLQKLRRDLLQHRLHVLVSALLCPLLLEFIF